jgi:glutamyl-tRNA reductase
MASEVVAGEMQRLDLRLPQLTDREREEVHRAVRRVVDKLLHAPTVRVQELAADSATVDYAAALRELFALDPQTVAAVMSPEVPL